MNVTFTEFHSRELSSEELKEATIEFIEFVVMDGCYINASGELEFWEDTGHGSGLTTNYGKPSEIQDTAWKLLKMIRAHNSGSYDD